MSLRLSENGRYFVASDGKPFFYLADTAWMLLHALSFDDADDYLRTRAEQGFTVIATVALSEFGGLSTPNANGDHALLDWDTAEPNPAYFAHVDRVIERAADYGLTVALLATWGDKVQPWNDGREGIFSPRYQDQGRDAAMAKAHAWGLWIAGRYRDQDNLVWINGGDRGPSGPNYEETGQDYWDIWDALGRGLREGDGGEHLISFHPPGGYSSSYWFHHADWLAFNQIQSGHWNRDIDNHAMLMQDYHRLPVRPMFDGEPCYESHPVQYRAEMGAFDDYDVRKKAYHALFAGAAGHTYGANSVFQFQKTREETIFRASLTWREALLLPGATQMQHCRRLFEPRLAARLIPDRKLLLTEPGVGGEAIYALIGEQRKTALVYTSAGNPFIVDLARLSGASVSSFWYSPRTGAATERTPHPAKSPQAFVPPLGDPGQPATPRADWMPKVGGDWILVLESEDE